MRRTGESPSDGTFAPHAMPKLGGSVEGFQIDLFTEVAHRMRREITIDAASFSTPDSAGNKRSGSL